MIYDISRLLNANTPTWPGDTPFSYNLTWSQEETGSVNVGQITTSCHTATHVDAPFHFKDSGMTIEQLPLELFVGDALVVDVTTKGEITPKDFDGLDLSEVRRVLLKTETWTDDVFPEKFQSFILTSDLFLKTWHRTSRCGFTVSRSVRQ
ncbi:cyclase family protein [Piscibacillus salipiscarius]|uniref:cyclase family protein n=1 Tax=Piscibacillus salipiscarius TaxID=299480 RepID=UPI000A9ABB86